MSPTVLVCVLELDCSNRFSHAIIFVTIFYPPILPDLLSRMGQITEFYQFRRFNINSAGYRFHPIFVLYLLTPPNFLFIDSVLLFQFLLTVLVRRTCSNHFSVPSINLEFSRFLYPLVRSLIHHCFDSEMNLYGS